IYSSARPTNSENLNPEQSLNCLGRSLATPKPWEPCSQLCWGALGPSAWCWPSRWSSRWCENTESWMRDAVGDEVTSLLLYCTVGFLANAAWYVSTNSLIRCASPLVCPWLASGSEPPEDSIKISDQTIPVLICTEATLLMLTLISSRLNHERLC